MSKAHMKAQVGQCTTDLIKFNILPANNYLTGQTKYVFLLNCLKVITTGWTTLWLHSGNTNSQHNTPWSMQTHPGVYCVIIMCQS